MKYFFDHLSEVQTFLDGPVVAFFDFDMTLAPASKRPEDTALSGSVKQYLTALSSKIPVGIISGRALDDILSRVDIPGLMYAGNHGMEWCIDEQQYAIDFDESSLIEAREKLNVLSHKYPQDIYIEDKKYTIALHYRMASKSQIPLIENALKELSFPKVAVRWSKMTFEVRPQGNWNKGNVCLEMMKKIHSSAKPLYIGDDLTDEDAFRALSHGVTVRVGKKTTSKAQYYIKNQKEIGVFLKHILQHVHS